jgi:hypothetical protein
LAAYEASSITLCWRLASSPTLDYCGDMRFGMEDCSCCHAMFPYRRIAFGRELNIETDCLIVSLCSSIADVDLDRKE